MSNLTYIYKKENEKILLFDTLNYTIDEFKINPQSCLPSWDKENMIASSMKYDYPTIDIKTNELREKTREEKIIEGQTDLLFGGEYVEGNKIITVPCENNYFKKLWNKEKHYWYEGATLEEQTTEYFNKINTYKAEILQNGFNFNGHQQKCREKDLALLSNAVSALDDMQAFKVIAEEHQINWSFNDNDIVGMTETDLRKLRISGAIFINAVYGAEAEFKASTPAADFKKEDFISKINELSEIKCFTTDL